MVRTRRLVVAVLVAAVWGAGVMALAVYVVGRLATDRWELTQLAYWIPAVWLAPGAIVLASLGAAWGLRVFGRRGGGRGAAWVRRGAAVTFAAATFAAVWLGAVEWRLGNSLFAARAGGPSVRVMHWNMTSVYKGFPESLLADLHGSADTDVFIFTVNMEYPRYRALVRELNRSQGLETGASGERGSAAGDGGVAVGTDGRSAFVEARHGQLAIASRYPVIRTQRFSLNLPAPEEMKDPDARGSEVGELPSRDAPYAPDRHWAQPLFNAAADAVGAGHRKIDYADPGLVYSVELETTEVLGRPLVVWLVDLPSSPLVPRHAMARAASGSLSRLVESGHLPTAPRQSGPDLMTGDFNIPRGSASLRVLAPGTREAYAEAGWGLMGTWPRRRPWWAIDHFLVSEGLRAAEYRVFDPGFSEHRAHSVLIWSDGTFRGGEGR